MKKLIPSLIALLMISTATFADTGITVTNDGWCSGKYTVTLSYPNDWKGTSITIGGLGLNGQNYYATDTTFTLPSSSSFVLIKLYQPNQNQPLVFGIMHNVGNNKIFGPYFTDKNTSCSLPVKWTNISVTTDANDSTLIHAKWTTTMEQNVKGFTLQASTNGITWDDVKTIGSSVGGNSSTATVYSVDYTNPLVALVMTAGFGLIGSLLVIGLIVGFIGKKHKGLGIAAAILLVFMMVSCSKHNDLATPKAKKYHYFRVVETDLDGTPTYSQVFAIK